MKKIAIMLTLLVLAMPLASAATYSLVDEKFLPVTRINDPISHENEKIILYSFEQLDNYLWNSPGFLRWNDAKRVCEAMQIMFGKVSSRCHNLPPKKVTVREPDVFIAPTRQVASHARVSLGIRRPETSPQVVHVQPPYRIFHNVWYPYW